jgi:hypothetical protein
MLASAENDPRRAGTIWAMNLDEAMPVIAPLAAATFRQVGPECTAVLAAAYGAGSSAEIQSRFESGRRCYTAWVGGQLASYGWVSYEDELVGELDLRLRLLPGEAYIWDCATVPAFRQLRLYTALLVYIVGELRTQPLCRVWIGANMENVASQRGIAHAGFRPVADLLVEHILALRLVQVQGHPDVPDKLVSEVRRAFLNNRDKIWLDALASAKRG